jgi:YVTN family beta-propeller protein
VSRHIRFVTILLLSAFLMAIIIVLGPTTFAEPTNTYIYVSNTGTGSASVSIIDAITLQKITDIKTSSSPSDIIVNSAGTLLWVASDYNGIDVYSTIDYTLVKHITIPDQQVTRMAMSPDGTTVIVTIGSMKVIKIDATTYTVVATIDFGILHAPWGVTYYNGYYYVADQLNKSVVKLDSNLNIIKWYGTGAAGGPFTGPYDVIADARNNRVLVVNSNATTTIIDITTDTVSGVLNLSRVPGGGQQGISVNSSGYVYRSDYTNGNITIFKPDNSILVNITGFWRPEGIICNNYNKTVFVADNAAGLIYVIDGATVIGSIRVGNRPYRVSIGTQAITAAGLVQFRTVTAFSTMSVTNVNITVYDSYNQLLYSDITDERGVSAFYLNPTVKYNILFNQTPNINQWYNITPTQSSYLVSIPFDQVLGLSSWSDTFLPDEASSVARYTIDHPFNSTSGAGYMNATYTDSSGLTTSAGFFLYKNGSVVGDTITLVDSLLDSSEPYMCNFSIAQAAGNSYQIVILANQTGGAQYSYSQGLGYRFPGPKWLSGVLPLNWYFWIAFGIVLIFFSVGTISKKGLFGVFGAVSGAILTHAGWFSLYLPDAIAFSVCGVVFILSIVMYFVERERYT